MLYGPSAVLHEEPKSIFSGKYHKGNEIFLPQYLVCQARAKAQAEILTRIAQELPLKKQPCNETNNFSATKYSRCHLLFLFFL